jgi:hypothetical protein
LEGWSFTTKLHPQLQLFIDYLLLIIYNSAANYKHFNVNCK